jgi:CDP-paratose 2-epimerase
MKKILITGGCGFIGSNLAIFLKKKKFHVDTIDNFQRFGSKLNLKDNKKHNIKNFQKDLSKFEDLKKLPKYDIIIDCCAEPSVEASKNELDRVIDTNFLGTYNILKKCIKDKSKLIFFSSSRVYSILELKKLINKTNIVNKIKVKNEIGLNFNTNSPKSIYGFTKLASEELIKEFSYCFGLKYIITRLGVVSGPKQMAKVDQGFFSLWIWKHLNYLPLSYIGFGGHGYQERDILHVDDLNEFVYAQILKFKTIFNVTLSAGGGKKNLISLKKLTNLCQKITGNKTKISSISKTSIFDIPYFCTSNEVSKKLYNWSPKKNLDDIAEDILRWQKKEFKNLKKYFK